MNEKRLLHLCWPSWHIWKKGVGSFRDFLSCSKLWSPWLCFPFPSCSCPSHIPHSFSGASSLGWDTALAPSLVPLPSGDTQFPWGNGKFSPHLLWSLKIWCELEQEDQSCLHKHIQWFCPLISRFVFHCLDWSWFLPQHVLWWQLPSLFPL